MNLFFNIKDLKYLNLEVINIANKLRK